MQIHLETSNSEENSASLIPNFRLLAPYMKVLPHTHSAATNKINTPDAANYEDIRDKFEVMEFATSLGLDAVVFEDHASTPNQPVPIEPNHRIQSILMTESEAADEYNRTIAPTEGPVMLTGVESSLLFDYEGKPRTDIHPDGLKNFDVVTASVHGLPSFVNSRDPDLYLSLYLYAANNPDVDVVGHFFRHREFYPNDWSYFLKYYRDADTQVFSVLDQIERDKDYDTLRKIIGKQPFDVSDIEGTDSSLFFDLHNRFKKLEEDYWSVCEVILDRLALTGTALEINLNSINPSKEPFKKLIGMIAQRPNLLLSMSFDFHNQHQLKAINTKIPLVIDLLEQNGIESSQFITSSLERYLEFIEFRKSFS